MKNRQESKQALLNLLMKNEDTAMSIDKVIEGIQQLKNAKKNKKTNG